MRVATFASLAVVLAGVFRLDTAAAAPAGLPDSPLDLDLKQADIQNVYALLSDFTGRKFVLDPCVHGAVDLRMQNTPAAVALDALAAKLQVAYDDDGDVIHVVCKDADAATANVAAARVTVSETGAALPDILGRLATAAKLAGVEYRASARPSVDVTLRGVRLATALAALEDESGVKIRVVKNRLVVTD